MAKVASMFIAHLELVLAAMSIPVVGALHYFVGMHFDNPWKITAAAALSVGILHGFLAWFVRERQRSVRLQLLQRTAAILQQAAATDSNGSQSAGTNGFQVRLAQAQLVALVREPLIIRTKLSSASLDLERLDHLNV